MKKSNKIVFAALLTFVLTLCSHINVFAYSFILENDYRDIVGIHNKLPAKQSLALNTNQNFNPNLITINYLPNLKPLKSKIIFAIKDLLRLSKKEGVKTSSIKVDKQTLAVTYFYQFRYVDNDDGDVKKSGKHGKKNKKKKNKKWKDKITNKIKKIKNKIWGRQIDDVYVKILSAQLDGVELEKLERSDK